ncbi:RxLR effector protein [Phytophthora megakarya]|uniref:RxLR effector protein n=1 Tax=Phytophthora megakarya TaxID=4795 RepID=A0A225V8Q4_9STRA|nr:RxLR effector protein [Phytophthora megakarya]
MGLYSVALLVAAVFLTNIERATSFELTLANYPSFADHSNAVVQKRLLRNYDDDAEERAIGTGVFSDLVTKIKGGASTIAGKFGKGNKYEARLVASLKLAQIDDTLTSSKLKELTNQIDKINSKKVRVTLIGTLTSRYGDDALAMALLSARHKADSTFKGEIDLLRKQQLARWMKDDNSAGDVFKLLKMDKEVSSRGYKMIRDEKFKILENYVKFVNTQNPGKASLLGGLTAGLGGEEKLWSFLQIAKAHSSTKEKAQSLETSLITKWTGEGQLPTNVFQWLNLYYVDNAFSADNLNRFSKYVDDFNQKRPNEKSLLDIYTNSMKDTLVAEKLIQAMKIPATKDVATKLQKQQLEGWINSGSVEKLKEFVHLNGGGNLIDTLSIKLGDNLKLTLALEKASNVETTPLQKLQYAGWVERHVTPDNILSHVFKKAPGTAINDLTTEEKNIVDKFTKIYNLIKAGD